MRWVSRASAVHDARPAWRRRSKDQGTEETREGREGREWRDCQYRSECVYLVTSRADRCIRVPVVMFVPTPCCPDLMWPAAVGSVWRQESEGGVRQGRVG